MHNILVIDDDAEIRYSLDRVLSNRDYQVHAAPSGEEGLKMAKELQPEVILLDNRMGGMSGLETLQHLRTTAPKTMVVLMTAYGTTQTAIEAMKYGAFDYIIKPFDLKKILGIITRACEAAADLRNAGEAYKSLLNSDDYGEGIVGSSEAMQEVFKVMGQVAASEVTVLITGESGTGKELVARGVHQHSHRSNMRFVGVNCAAIPENLIESELFGHEKGSFTGAVSQHKGQFELADKGTIFLDEIGDMSLPTQTKILRVLQEGEIQRVGGTGTINVDVRLVAATNKDLEEMVKKGDFREDLYYRLNVVRIRLPSLSDRMEDVPQLIDFMLQRLNKEQLTKVNSISKDAINVLCQYPWPGNVRELENVIYRSAVIAQGNTIILKDLPQEILDSVKKNNQHTTQRPASTSSSEPAPAEPAEKQVPDLESVPLQPVIPPVAPPPSVEEATLLGVHHDPLRNLTLEAAFDFIYEKVKETEGRNILQAVEKEIVLRALQENKGNQVKASGTLGITRTTIRKRIEQFDLKF